MAEEFDFHPMWESLGMNLADHDMLLGAVGQMYGDMFLTQNNRPKSTSYLDFVATNIHSGRIKEMLDKKEAGEATKIDRAGEGGGHVEVVRFGERELLHACTVVRCRLRIFRERRRAHDDAFRAHRRSEPPDDVGRARAADDSIFGNALGAR